MWWDDSTKGGYRHAVVGLGCRVPANFKLDSSGTFAKKGIIDHSSRYLVAFIESRGSTDGLEERVILSHHLSLTRPIQQYDQGSSSSWIDCPIMAWPWWWSGASLRFCPVISVPIRGRACPLVQNYFTLITSTSRPTCLFSLANGWAKENWRRGLKQAWM